MKVQLASAVALGLALTQATGCSPALAAPAPQVARPVSVKLAPVVKLDVARPVRVIGTVGPRREAKLAEALRENLRRRKTQARALGTTDAAGETPAPTDRTEGTLPKPPLSR